MKHSPGATSSLPRSFVPMLGALLLVVVVGGCASLETRATKLQAIKTIGIISAVGDDLTLTKAGLTGLEARNQSFSIEPWGIDDLIVSRASALLSPHFQVQPVTYRRADFAALERDNPITLVNLMRDDPIKELVRSQVSPQGLDAYVVITKAKSTYGSGGRAIAGIGVVNGGTMFDSHAQAHALYMIRVIDGHEFKIIDKKSASPVDNTEIVRLAGPSRMIDDSVLPKGNDAAGNEQLKATITDLIERSLPTTLQDLHLVDRS
jgi:hypothetical protein